MRKFIMIAAVLIMTQYLGTYSIYAAQSANEQKNISMDEIQQNIAEFHNKDYKVRNNAVASLVLIGESAVQPLIDAYCQSALNFDPP